MPRDAVYMMKCGILGVLEFPKSELFPDQDEEIRPEIPSPYTEVPYLLGLKKKAAKAIAFLDDEEKLGVIPSDAFRDTSGIYAAYFDVPGPFAFNENWRPPYVSPDRPLIPREEPETVISFTSNILRLKRAKVPGEDYQSHDKRGRQPRSRFDRNTPRRLSTI